MTKKLMRYLMAALVVLLLAAVKPVEVKAMPRPAMLYGWTQTDMCLRSHPGFGGNVVAVVPKGAEVVVVSTDDNPVDGFHWAYVRYPDVEGYMAYANQSQSMKFLEFQQWNPVEESSGWARLLREVTLYSGPNPELSGESEGLAQLEPGREIYIQAELAPVKYGSNICRVRVDGVEGYINANVSQVNPETYEYIGISDFYSYTPATTPTTSKQIEKTGIVNRPMCLRTLPTTNSEVLRVLDTYEELWVEALETNASGEQWYRVITGTYEAYVAAFGINVGGKTLDRDAETNTDLNLRSGPSTTAQRWVTLPEGYPVWCMSEFSGVGTSEKWVRVAVDYEGHKYYGFVVGWGLTQ